MPSVTRLALRDAITAALWANVRPRRGVRLPRRGPQGEYENPMSSKRSAGANGSPMTSHLVHPSCLTRPISLGSS